MKVEDTFSVIYTSVFIACMEESRDGCLPEKVFELVGMDADHVGVAFVATQEDVVHASRRGVVEEEVDEGHRCDEDSGSESGESQNEMAMIVRYVPQHFDQFPELDSSMESLPLKMIFFSFRIVRSVVLSRGMIIYQGLMMVGIQFLVNPKLTLMCLKGIYLHFFLSCMDLAHC